MAVLLGRYELVRPIAKGGMATVYLARVVGEGGFERLVALKLMHPHIAEEPEFVAMFLDEARLAARIRHPNVVPTLAVERSPDGLFLVLEYIDGHALHSLIRAQSRTKDPIPLGIALRIVIDMLEGLHAAHELHDENGAPLNLVHRDVSPQNVLIGVDGVARITDFGVAHARARLATTQGASLKGKVAYLSPEQITSGDVDRRSDLFAAGIVLWEMLVLRRLFRGDSEGQTLAQIIAGVKQAPHEVRPHVPPPVSAVCMRALHSSPGQRFQTALEMVEALETAAAQVGVAIAKPREVGAFVQSLHIVETPGDAKMPSGSGATARAAMPSVASASLPMLSATHAPAVVPARRKGVLLAGMGVAALGVVGIVAVVATRGDAQPAVSGVSPPVAPSGTPPAPSAEATTQPAPTASRVASTEAEPPPADSGAAAASAPSTAIAPRGPKAPPTKGKLPRTSKGGAGYRPDEL